MKTTDRPRTQAPPPAEPTTRARTRALENWHALRRLRRRLPAAVQQSALDLLESGFFDSDRVPDASALHCPWFRIMVRVGFRTFAGAPTDLIIDACRTVAYWCALDLGAGKRPGSATVARDAMKIYVRCPPRSEMLLAMCLGDRLALKLREIASAGALGDRLRTRTFSDLFGDQIPEMADVRGPKSCCSASLRRNADPTRQETLE